MGAATGKGVQVVLGPESKQHPLIAAFRVVTEEGVKALIARPQERDPFSQMKRFSNQISGGYDTGGHHVGRVLSQKFNPGTLDVEGPNPMGSRSFLGDEFQGMLMFGKASEGKPAEPAFYSLWPEGTPPEARRTLVLNIATNQIPPSMDDPQSRISQSLKKLDVLLGRPMRSVFYPVGPDVRNAVRKFAQSFEKTYGIKVDIRYDVPDAQINLLGYSEGKKDNTAGSASFPEAVSSWPKLEEFGHTPAYMLVNMDMAHKLDKQTIQELVNHELLHCMGLAHPHDLAIFRSLDMQSALGMTQMAYSDLKPVAVGRQEDVGFGALDFGLRKWVHNPPALNAGNAVFDLEKAHKAALKRNKRTATFRQAGILPTLSLFAHGRNNTLIGTQGDDYLDTNTGYISRVTKDGAPMNAVLLEGHIEHVHCVAGNNTVVACKTGDQDIHTGTGRTELHLVYPGMTGTKTLDVQGQATLLLTASFLKSEPDLQVLAQGRETVLKGTNSTLRVQGRGLSALKLVDESGHSLYEQTLDGSPTALASAMKEAGTLAAAHQPKAPDVRPDMPDNWQERVKRQQSGVTAQDRLRA